MDDTSSFVLATCQPGAESVLKDECARCQPDWRLSYSRPGFLTFKVAGPLDLQAPLTFKSVFARAISHSLGRARGNSSGPSSPHDLSISIWDRVGDVPIDRVHVWSRDERLPGDEGFQPGVGETTDAARAAIVDAAPAGFAHLLDETKRGDLVLDCVVVAPDEWWFGLHRATSRVTRWPGGIWPGQQPENMVSRAYLKTSEALDWMRFPLKTGQRCVELGCAPGGSTQALLDRGLRVTGIDPAHVDPQILQRKHFQHWRKRGADVRRRDYAQFQWLFADMNVAPAYTLASVRDIVAHRLVNIRGLIMNLKLPGWQLAAEIPAYVAEVRNWGYPVVRARQLSHNRQEICLAALRPARPGRRGRRDRARTAIAARQTGHDRA